MLLPPLQRKPPGPTELDRAVEAVLARPEFAGRELPAPLRWMVDLWTSARQAAWNAFRELVDASGAASVLVWLFVGWLTVTLVALLVHLGYTAVRAWRARDRSRDRGGTPEGTADAGAGSRPATWEERAGRDAAEGRLREAAVALYRAVLLRLDERGVLSFDPSKTPGDYRRETADDPASAGALRRFLQRFEPIAFGGRAVSPAAWERLVSAAREAGARV